LCVLSLLGSSSAMIKAPGYCAMYGICSLPSEQWRNCPNNTQAVVPDFDISVCPQFKVRMRRGTEGMLRM